MFKETATLCSMLGPEAALEFVESILKKAKEAVIHYPLASGLSDGIYDVKLKSIVSERGKTMLLTINNKGFEQMFELRKIIAMYPKELLDAKS